jgi:hypothetical protein
MPAVTLDANNSLRAFRRTDAERHDEAHVEHDVEAGAVVQVGSSGGSEVTAEITGADGGATFTCANPAEIFARLRAGHQVTNASDTRAMQLSVNASLDAALQMRGHAEVFARLDGGELANAGSSTITNPCDDEAAPAEQDRPADPTPRALPGGG